MPMIRFNLNKSLIQFIKKRIGIFISYLTGFRNEELEINDCTRILASYLSLQNQKVIFFIGAGVSATSGLPLGDQLRNTILAKYYQEYPYWDNQMEQKFLKEFYPEQENLTLEMVLQHIGQSLGYDSISDYLKLVFDNKDKKEPSLSHEVISFLSEYRQKPKPESIMKSGEDFLSKPLPKSLSKELSPQKNFISLVITTNFDNLIEEALDRRKIKFRVISERDQAFNFDEDYNNEIIIWKIHGSLDNPRSLCATQQDILHFPKEKYDSLLNLFQYNNIVFLGYSMRDPDIMEVINAITPNNKINGFFWVDPNKLNKNNEAILKKFNQTQNQIKSFSDDFFNEINYLLHLSDPAIIWKADEANVLQGGVRDNKDPWNRDCLPFTRIFGADKDQENYKDWGGAVIQLKKTLCEPLKLRNQCIGAKLKIIIPPIDGKGIHGKKGGKVKLFLIKNGEKIKISELECSEFGYFSTFWPHRDRFFGIHPGFTVNSCSVIHFNGLKDIILEIKIDKQVCMDVSTFELSFY